MMRDVTKKKWAAIASGAAVALVLLAYLGAVLFAVLSENADELAALGLVGLYGGLILAVVAGIFFALRQRLKELDSGEEEDARQY